MNILEKIIISLVFFLCFFAKTTKSTQDHDFFYRNYNEILEQIHDFSTQYPFNIRIYNDESENVFLPDIENCGNNKCSYTYFILSDFSQTKEKISQLPQVFFVAGIHGDEIVGPNVVISFAKYLLENYQRNETLKNYIQNRMIICFPLSNPVGYYHNQRQEKHKNGKSYDPNRDFPYNVKDDCFKTATALMINHIYGQYLIKSAISFHGGDNSITYPWGGYNHATQKSPHSFISELAPDNQAFFDIASDLESIADENPSKQVEKYLKGTMNEVVYPVNGGLEDWAYAGGWENDYSGSAPLISPCKAFNDNELKIQTNRSHIRSILFLVECGNLKAPPEDSLGKQSGLLQKTKENWGHIDRNIALSLDLIKLTSPFIIEKEVNFLDYSVKIQWEAGGCLRVSSTFLLWKEHDPHELFDPKNLINESFLQKWQKTENLKKNTTFPSNFNFDYNLNYTSFQEIDVLIALQCDQEWGKMNENSVPLAPPQSHLVLARTKEDYYSENNGFVINSEKTVYKHLKKINFKTFEQKQKKNFKLNDLVIQSRFHKCFAIGSTKDFEEKNFLIFSSNEYENNFTIDRNVKYFNNNFKAFLFNNGDISSCDSFHLGRNLNLSSELFTTEDFLNLSNFENSTAFFLKSENSSQKLSLTINEDLLNIDKILGRSLLLYEKQEFLIGQLTLLQNYHCEQEARNCMGFSLKNDDGICLLMNEFKFNEKNDFLIKILLQNNAINGTIFMKIIVDYKKMTEIYDQIEKIIIRNEDFEVEYPMSKENISSNLFVSDSIFFNLNATNALSNKLLIIGENNRNRIKIGLCSITIIENSVFYVEKNEIYESKAENDSIIWIIASFVGFIFLIITARLLIKVIKNRISLKTGNENKQLIFENKKFSENINADLNGYTITPKFLDNVSSMNEELDSDKI